MFSFGTQYVIINNIIIGTPQSPINEN